MNSLANTNLDTERLDRPKSTIKCRICYALEDPVSNICDLISPCKCKGSMRYVHRSCLKVWRYKSKRFAEMKRCEYCLSSYTIEDEILPHKTFTRSITLLILISFFLIIHYTINLFLEIFFVLRGGIVNFQENIFYKAGSMPDCSSITNDDLLFPKLTFCGTLVIISMFFQFFKKRNLFHSFNYMFTLWRVIYFNFCIDSLYFLMLNMLQVYYLTCEFCFVIDYIVYFAINLK